jgi:hypothetical protein
MVAEIMCLGGDRDEYPGVLPHFLRQAALLKHRDANKQEPDAAENVRRI